MIENNFDVRKQFWKVDEYQDAKEKMAVWVGNVEKELEVMNAQRETFVRRNIVLEAEMERQAKSKFDL